MLGLIGYDQSIAILSSTIVHDTIRPTTPLPQTYQSTGSLEIWVSSLPREAQVQDDQNVHMAFFYAVAFRGAVIVPQCKSCAAAHVSHVAEKIARSDAHFLASRRQ